jgi:cell division protein FtsQ
MRRLSLLLILVIVGGVVAAAYALRVDQVRVTGLRTLAAADVIRASGVEPGQRILWIRLSAAARHVESIPAVERATATRMLPGTVVIHITERTALAKLAPTPDLVSDATGHVFPEASARGLPTLDGWRVRKHSRRELDGVSRAVLQAFDRFPDALRARTQRIVVRPLFTLRLTRSIEVRFGRLDHLGAKAAAALAVLRKEGSHPVGYIDVQLPTVPVVGPVATPTPAPSAAPAPVAPEPAATAAPQPIAAR